MAGDRATHSSMHTSNRAAAISRPWSSRRRLSPRGVVSETGFLSRIGVAPRPESQPRRGGAVFGRASARVSQTQIRPA